MQYFEKRYYDPTIGRFTTQDPVFWEVGFTKRPDQYFLDPEQWNTYSYVRNNPINMVDPTGEILAGDVGNPVSDAIGIGVAVGGYVGSQIIVPGVERIGQSLGDAISSIDFSSSATS